MSADVTAHVGYRAVRAGMRARSLLLKRRLQSELVQDKSRALGIVAVGVVVAAAIFGVAFFGGHFIVSHGAAEVLPTLMSGGLLGLAAALILSSVGHAAQYFFAAKDLWFWESTPVPPWARFIDRALETLQAAAPTTVALGISALVGGALGSDLGLFGALRAVLAVLLIATVPVTLGILLAHLGGALLPAGRLRRFSIVILGVVVCAGLVWFRRARIEQWIGPQGPERILESAKSVKQLGPAALPSSLGATFVVTGDLASLAGLVAWVVGFALLAFLAHRLLSRRARDLAVDESPVGILHGSRRDKILKLVVRPASPLLRPVVEKDLLGFFRDPAQWGQGILLLGVGVLYLVNASILESTFGQLSEKNIGAAVLPAMHTGLVSFIAAGLAVRFAFPQVGLEGPAIWIVDGSPLSARQLLNAKVLASLPVVVIYPTLVAAFGGFFVDLQPSLWFLTTFICASVSLGVAAFGVGRGAVRPLFDATNLSELAIGPGAISTMMISVSLAFFGSVGALFAGAVVVGGDAVHGPGLVIAAGALLCALVPALTALYAGWRALETGAVAFVKRREDEATKQFLSDVDRPIIVDV